MTRAEDLPQRFVRLSAAIRAELTQLARVTAEAELALRDFPAAVPPPRELRGIGAIIHDFYTGAEHVFEKIAAELDGGVPDGFELEWARLKPLLARLPALSKQVEGEVRTFLSFLDAALA